MLFLLLGYRVAPVIWIGAFLANLETGASFSVAVAIACGNTLEAWFAAYALNRLRFHPALERTRDVFSLIVLGAVFSPLLSASIGSVSLVLGGTVPIGQFWTLWIAWWLGDATADILVAPFLLAWCSRTIFFPLSTSRKIELLSLVSSQIGISLVVFTDLFGALSPFVGQSYFFLPLVLWGGLRFGQRGATLVSSLAAAVSIWGTSKGLGPFASLSLFESLLKQQLFFTVISITGLFRYELV